MKGPIVAAATFILLVHVQTSDSKAQASSPPRTGERSSKASQANDEAKGRARLLSDSASETVTWLKQAIERHPDSKVLHWLLVRAYLKDNNAFWALRTLMLLSERFPKDCEPPLWTAWIQIQQGALEEARDALSSAKCRSNTPDSARKALLLSMVEQHAKEHERARKRLEKARHASVVFAEDRDAIERQITMLEPGYIAPLTAKLDLSLGWTSNAIAGSPIDAESARDDASSPVGQTGLWLRFVAPTSRYIRPTVELDGRARGYASDVGQPFSSLLMGGRPGLIIGHTTPNVLVAYHYEAYLNADGDQYDEEGPLWLYDAHRGEVEMNILSSLTLFGGVGYRTFRRLARSRTEVDGGIGGNLSITEVWRLLGALSARGHIANHDAYDLIGGSLLLSAEIRLPDRWAVRAGALVDTDAYPRSRGYFGSASEDDKRTEIALKLSSSGFSPPFWEGFKIGVTYEYAQRLSSIALYDYTEHRVLLKLLWNLSFDPFLPRTIAPIDHVAIDYGFEAEEMEERIQDLLRRDESVQRGSSCVD